VKDPVFVVVCFPLTSSFRAPAAPAKNKVQKGVLFFGVEKRPSTYQVCHAIHHNFTTKTPRSAHRFSRNTPANTTFHHTKKICNFNPSKQVPLLSKAKRKRKLLFI
jgi:hypothetical protein